MQVVSIINHKGGVGKTTLTANLGAGLAARGKKVLLLDLDSQASLTVSFFTPTEWAEQLLPSRTIKHWFDGVGTPEEMSSPAGLVATPRRVHEKLSRSPGCLDLIPAHRDLSDVDTMLAAQLLMDPEKFLTLHSRLRDGLNHEAFAGYDTVLIDCAPNFGLVARNAVAASDMLLIPTKPDYLSTNGIDSLGLKIAQFVEEYNARSAADPIARLDTAHHAALETTIRDSKAVYGPAPEYGVPVILGGTGRAQTRELRELVSELTDRLDGVDGMAA